MTELSAETKGQIFCALGKAVVRIWSNLPQDVQHHLFEEAVVSQGESKRQQLAIHLHDEHQRTADALNAIPTPDSLGAKGLPGHGDHRPTLFLQPIAHTIDCLY
jgi:predicted flavoprotein YhiN